MSAINESIAYIQKLAEDVQALSPGDLALFRNILPKDVTDTLGGGATPAPAPGAPKRPVTLEGAQKVGDKRPSSGLSSAEEQGADAVLPPTAKKKKLPGGDDDDGDDGEEYTDREVATALAFDKTPAKPAAGSAGGGANGNSGGMSAGGGATGAATKGVASAGGKDDVSVDEDSEDEDVAEGLQRKGGSSDANPGEANDDVANDAPAGDAKDEVEEPSEGEAGEDDDDAIVASPAKPLGTSFCFTKGVDQSQWFIQMNLGLYTATGPGQNGKHLLVIGYSGGVTGTPKRANGLSGRVITGLANHFASFGSLWWVYADGQLGRKLGQSDREKSYSAHALEEMWKHALSDYTTPFAKEKYSFDSKEQAEEARHKICKSMEDLIKNGTVEIPSKYNDASAGKITIDRDPSTKNFFTSSETGQGMASDGAPNPSMQQREAWKQTRADFNDRDFWAKMKFIDDHGKKARCVVKWLDEEIRPKAKWEDLEPDEKKKLLERGIRPVHWKSDRSDFVSEEDEQRWDDKFRGLGAFQKRGFGKGSRPPGHTMSGKEAVPCYFLVPEDDAELLALAKEIENDIKYWTGKGGGTFFAKQANRYYTEYGLLEFAPDRRGCGQMNLETSAITLADWMEKTGINKWRHAKKMKWAKELKVPRCELGPCACTTPHSTSMITHCIPLICGKCCMWHWVAPACLKLSPTECEAKTWMCVDCGGRKMTNALRGVEEANERKAAKARERTQELAADAEETAEEAKAAEMKKAKDSAIKCVLTQVRKDMRKVGMEFDAKSPDNAETAMEVLVDQGWKLKLSDDEFALVCNSAAETLLSMDL